MKPQAVIWDWNGTLLDDVHLCHAILNRLLVRYGYAPVETLAQYKEIFGFPIEDYYRRAGFDFSKHPYKMLADEFMDMYLPESEACPLQPGAVQTLESIAALGVPQVVLSASRTDILNDQLQRLGVARYFNETLGIGDVYAKSKVQLGVQWVQQCGYAPQNLIMIGDTEHDGETAAAMGVRSVYFAGGHRLASSLAQTGEMVFNSLESFADYIREEDAK